MQAQTTLAKREALEEVGNRERVAGLEVPFRYPAGSRIVKQERCQGEQKAEGGPFGNLRGVGIFIVSFENEICANKDILLVGTELRMGVDNTKEHEGPDLEKALSSWFSGFAHESQCHRFSKRFALVYPDARGLQVRGGDG